MKKLQIYIIQKIILSILLFIVFIVFIVSLLNHFQNASHWTLVFSSALNVITIFIIYFFSYQKTKIVLYKEQIVYRLFGQKNDEIILVNPHSEFTKDWKEIIIKTANETHRISLDRINKKEANNIFIEILYFYKKN